MAQRRTFKHQCDEHSKKEYRGLNNELRKETDKARTKWWEEQCDEIEDMQKQGKHAQACSKIHQLQKRKCKNRTEIKDKLTERRRSDQKPLERIHRRTVW